MEGLYSEVQWHIFSHPDCYRRLWNFARSADPALQALAGFHRRWGIAPRPEDVCLGFNFGIEQVATCVKPGMDPIDLSEPLPLHDCAQNQVRWRGCR